MNRYLLDVGDTEALRIDKSRSCFRGINFGGDQVQPPPPECVSLPGGLVNDAAFDHRQVNTNRVIDQDQVGVFADLQAAFT